MLHVEGWVLQQLSLVQVQVTTNDPCCSRLCNAAVLGLIAHVHELLRKIPLAFDRGCRRRHMGIEDQHSFPAARVPQEQQLHKDALARAEPLDGPGLDNFPIITRDEGYVWRVG